MDPKHYTADAICQAMGFPGFVDPALPSPSIRLLLKPSFDPEVCVTLSAGGDRPRLSVVAFTTMFWHHPGPVPYAPAAREEVVIPRDVTTDLWGRFAAAHDAAHEMAGRMVCIDGMPVECVAVENGEARRFAESPYRPAVAEFVSRSIWWAWTACRVPRVRNALAACARYVGKDYPREVVPEAPAPVRIMVLGTVENRAEVHETVPKPAAEASAS